MKKIFYWSPFLTKIATIKSVINSASILKKKDHLSEVYIINSVGEWNDYKNEIESKNLKIINLISFNLHNYLPKNGYLQSRLSLIIISFVTLLPLIFTLVKVKPNYFIAHLNTLMIMILSHFFKIKFIIRISGYPKLHFLRHFLWKMFSKKLFAIICPTDLTKKLLQEKKIFKENGIHRIEDPVFNLEEIKNNSGKKSNNLLAIGRLTKQKNFNFLINCFSYIEKKYPGTYKLNILGDGEQRNDLENLVSKLKLENSVYLIGHKDNVNDYFKESKCFILSSLWEDPGFVLIEAAMNETFILSSDCPNGPREFIENNKAGLLYESNNIESFLENFDKMLNLNDKDKNDIISFSKNKSYLYSSEEHYKKMKLIFK